jgi:hypothetical protein
MSPARQGLAMLVRLVTPFAAYHCQLQRRGTAKTRSAEINAGGLVDVVDRGVKHGLTFHRHQSYGDGDSTLSAGQFEFVGRDRGRADLFAAIF